MTAAGRKARARLAAHRRWQPGDDLDELTAQCLAELDATGADAGMDDLVAAAPPLTDEQGTRLRRLAEATGRTEAELGAHIRRVVDNMPPLSDGDLAKLVALLRPGPPPRPPAGPRCAAPGGP